MSRLLSVLLLIVVLAAVCSDHTVECVKRIRPQQWPPRNNECSCEEAGRRYPSTHSSDCSLVSKSGADLRLAGESVACTGEGSSRAVLPNKQLSCRKTFPPRSNQEKLKMMECLCKKHRHELHKKLRQDLQNMCKRIINTNPPIPIPLAR